MLADRRAKRVVLAGDKVGVLGDGGEGRYRANGQRGACGLQVPLVKDSSIRVSI